MDKRKFYKDSGHSSKSHYKSASKKVSGGAAVVSKSIKTQTDESSFVYNVCSCHKRFHSNNNLINDEFMQQAFNQNSFWKTTDCIPTYPICNCAMLPNASCSQSQYQPFPWYPTYGHYNSGCVPPPFSVPPPFLPVPLFHGGLLPFNSSSSNPTTTNNSVVNGNLECMSSKSSTNNAFKNSATSVMEIENLNNRSALHTLTDPVTNHPSGRNKLKTSYIRSEPNVTKSKHTVNFYNSNNIENKIKSDKNLLNNLLSKSVIKKNHYKSDTDIPVITESKNKKVVNHNSVVNSNNNCSKNNYLFSKKDSFNFISDSKGDCNNIIYNDRELKSPIYKYADIRIHELSSSLKNIKENIYKLSTKASELNVSEPGCDNNHFKKYFKTAYSESSDGEVTTLCVNDLLKQSNGKISGDWSNYINRNHGDSIRTKIIQQFNHNSLNNNDTVPSSSNLSQLKEEADEFMHRFFTKSNHENSSQSHSYSNQFNVMKRSMPLHDIPSALSRSDNILSQQVPVKMKSEFFNNKSETKIKNGEDRITAHVIVPNRSLDFSKKQQCNDGDKKVLCAQVSNNYNRKKLSSLNRQYANISFKVNYDSSNDEDSFESDRNKVPNAMDSDGNCKNDESSSLNENEKQCLSTFFHVEPEGFKNYSKLVFSNNEDEEEDDNNTPVGEYEDDVDCNNGEDDADYNNHIKEKSLPVIRSKQNMVNIENWLEKNVETGEKDAITYQNQSTAPTRRQSQLTALSNLEVLSKISEEDEDKFSTMSENSDQPKSYFIKERSSHRNNESNNKHNKSLIGVRNSSNAQCLVDKACFNDVTGGKEIENMVQKHPYVEDNHDSNWRIH